MLKSAVFCSPLVKIGEGKPPALLRVCIYFRHLLIFHPNFISQLKVSLAGFQARVGQQLFDKILRLWDVSSLLSEKQLLQGFIYTPPRGCLPSSHLKTAPWLYTASTPSSRVTM